MTPSKPYAKGRVVILKGLAVSCDRSTPAKFVLCLWLRREGVVRTSELLHFARVQGYLAHKKTPTPHHHRPLGLGLR